MGQVMNQTVISSTYRKNRSVPGIEYCQVSQTKHSFPKHTHDDIYIVGVMKKGASYCIGKEDSGSIAEKGKGFLINPGQVHSGIPASRCGVSYEMMTIDLNKMDQLACDIFENYQRLPEFISVVFSDYVAISLLLRLFKTMNDNNSLETETLLVEALSIILSGYGINKGVKKRLEGEEKSRIILAKDFLSSDLDQKITLNDVASAVGLSRYYFIRLFKKKTGMSPHAYRTQQRIEKSKSLLNNNTPLSDIASQTGFTDQSHFTHTFKSYTGVTPGYYGQYIRRGIQDDHKIISR